MDTLSPVAPARIRCLLLPYGRIKRARFLEFVERLRPVVAVRLGDISTNGGSDRNMFSPLAFPNGFVVYDITLSATTAAHRGLVPFELYRETLAVIAITDGSEHNITRDGTKGVAKEDAQVVQEYAGYISDITDNHPSAFVHQLIVFDCDLQTNSLPEGAVAIPPEGKAKPTAIKTVMCDLTSALLSEMTTFARSVQALPNLEIPKASKNNSSYDRTGSGSKPGSRTSSTTNSRTQSPTNELDKHAHRASLPAHLTTSLGGKLGGEVGRSKSAAENGRSNPATTFDQMNDVPERPTTTESVSRSRDRVSVHGFGPGSVNERARNQAKSRIGVVIGSMYLLAGRWPDAVKELTESATAAKANSDYAWHAKALDYLLVTVLMYGWAGMDFDIPQVLYPFGDKLALVSSKASKNGTTDSTSTTATNCAVSLQNLCGLLPDLANNILHFYTRAAQFSSSPVPQVVFSDTTIRLAKLLSLIHGSFGIMTPANLKFIVTASPTKADSTIPENTGPCPSRAEIATLLYRAYPNSIMDDSTDLMDRLSIFAGMASVLSSLGLHRKKAFILRDMLTILLPALVQSRKHSAAEQGIHPAASLSLYDVSGSDMGVSGVLGKHDGMDHGIQGFLIMICDVYGAILTSVNKSRSEVEGIVLEADIDDTSVIARRVIDYGIKRAFGNPILKLDVLRSCINICEALPDLRGVLRFSSDLLNTTGSGIAPGPGTTDSSPSIAIEDQIRLSNNISRTVSAAVQLGFNDLQAEYWDEFLLRDVSVLWNGTSNTPSARRKAELNLAANEATKTDGPFIYNPFAKPATAIKDTILIANEEVTLVILLQNLYDFELDIEWIKFDVPETLLDAKVQKLIIGAYRTEQIHVTAMPKADGQLKIEACIAKIRGCRPRRFPLFKDQWRMKNEIKVKRQGLSAATVPKERPLSVASEPGKTKKPSDSGMPVASTFEARIIKTQPTVIFKSTSLPQSALMLLEGESRRFSVTLQNTSKTPVDLLLLSSTDSTFEILQAGLDDNKLTPAELYDAEVNAYQRPALKILPHSQGSEVSIAAEGTITIDLEIYGKLNLTQAALKIEYGYLGVPRSEVDERFYTRQLSIPFSITVGASVGLVHNEILPFTGNFAWSNQLRNQNGGASASKKITAGMSPEQRFQGLLNRLGLGTQGDNHCLVALDFYNAWTNPISLSLQVRSQLSRSSPDDENWERAYSVHEILQPGHTSRVLVLLPRLTLEHPHKAIPSLRNKRQFVVSASQMSPDLERLSRELFWYREESLKYMRATWSEVRSSRTGQVDLRRLLLPPQMLDILKLEEVGINMALVPCQTTSEVSDDPNNSGIQQISRTHFSITSSSFYNLNTTITSRVSHPIYPLLRIQPALRNQPYNVALDLNKKLAFNGVLQRALPLLQPGEKRDVTLGIVFLAAGEYEFGACVEEVRVWREKKKEPEVKTRPRAGTGEMRAEDLVRTDRRTWFAREACSVDVSMGESANDKHEG